MTGVKIIDAGKAELRASFNHSADGHGTINSGDQSDDHWPTINQGERDGCIVSHRIATNVLEDIETMSLNHILENHLQERDPKAYSEISGDFTMLIGLKRGD